MLELIEWIVERAAEYSLASFSSWDRFASAIAKVPLIFTDFSHGLAWPYLLSSLIIAWIIFVLTKWRGGTGVQSFREFAFPSRLYLHRSSKLDCRFLALDTVLYCLLYVPIIAGINLLAGKAIGTVIFGLTSWEPPKTLSPVVAISAGITFLMLHDFITYWTHVLFHKVSFLWAFHQVHHSAEVLTPATAYRVHPVELIGFGVANAPVVGLAMVFYQNLIGPPMQVAAIFGVGIFGLLGSHLRHSHLLFSFGPLVSRIVLSPAQHVIHHSTDPRHWNKNFGVKFAFWDAFFGTLYIPRGRQSLEFGLPAENGNDFKTVGELYVLPFVKALRVLCEIGRPAKRLLLTRAVPIDRFY